MLHWLLLLSVPAAVLGHGGMVWPPIWQDGVGVSYKELTTNWTVPDQIYIQSDPVVVDPKTGRRIVNLKSWLTDDAYVGGIGKEFWGLGVVTNPVANEKARTTMTPWAAPGRTTELGQGCGIFGGNPHGCPAGKDTRDPKSNAFCDQPEYGRKKGTFAFGSRQLDIDFPAALNTRMQLGSKQTVAWVSGGGHNGGYTYRLCKLPAKGKQGLTEECFQQNVLEWASNSTWMRPVWQLDGWEEYPQTDVVVEGVAWRNVLKTLSNPGLMRTDEVWIPSNLPEGDYVMSFRWDSNDPQVWVSCSNVHLFNSIVGR